MTTRNRFYLVLPVLVSLFIAAPLLGQGDVVIDDFEGDTFAEYWDSWPPYDSISARCAVDQPGYESAHALWLTFDLGADESLVCGRGIFDNQEIMANSTGVSFYWRADRANVAIIVEAAFADPTQQDPDAGGLSAFRAPTQIIPADTDEKASRWAKAIIPWGTFSKVEWQKSGAHSFNPADLGRLNFIVEQPGAGTIWIDDIQLTYEGTTAVTAPQMTLADVNDFMLLWGGGVDLGAIGETAYDMIVIEDGFFASDNPTTLTARKLEAVKHSPGGEKIILSVLPVSYAENYRYYWRSNWEPGNPAWLGAPFPASGDVYRVQYWDPEWQAILFGSPDSYLDRILADGFDGVYLGTWSSHWIYFEAGRETAVDEMINLIVDLANYAHEKHPGFLVFVEDAPNYREDRPDFVAAIDGISQPNFYYGEGGPGNPVSFGTIGLLEPFLDQWVEAGKMVLVYASTTDPDQIADQYERSRSRGYIPYAGGEYLDHIVINPGYEPD